MPPEEVSPVDLVVCGSVLVSPDGSRIGKGGGYSDLEFAVLAALGRLSHDVCVVTTVHDMQVSYETLPMHPHDLPVDYVVTPTRTIRCAGPYIRPRGVLWDLLPRERLREIPVLKRLQREETAGNL